MSEKPFAALESCILLLSVTENDLVRAARAELENARELLGKLEAMQMRAESAEEDWQAAEHQSAELREALRWALGWSGSGGGQMSEQRVEELAVKFHDIYQQEAKRQGDVRHKDAYADLPENVKEFDRALARYVLATKDAEIAAAYDRAAQVIDECNREGPYQAIGAADHIRTLTPADASTARDAEIAAAFESVYTIAKELHICRDDLTQPADWEAHESDGYPHEYCPGCKLAKLTPAHGRAALAARDAEIERKARIACFEEFMVQVDKAEEFEGSFLYPLVLWVQECIAALKKTAGGGADPREAPSTNDS